MCGGLLVRHNVTDGACAFATWRLAGLGTEMLAAVEGRRWIIEDSFESAKNEPGLDHNPAYVIAWPQRRRAHQANARRSHLKARMQL